jgi:hypothetical protein
MPRLSGGDNTSTVGQVNDLIAQIKRLALKYPATTKAYDKRPRCGANNCLLRLLNTAY